MSNKKYTIQVPEIWNNYFDVIASCEEEAMTKLDEYFIKGESDDVKETPGGLELSHSLEQDQWTVALVEDEDGNEIREV